MTTPLEYQSFREQVRAFLRDKLTPDLEAAAARQAGVFAEPELGMAWHKILQAQGWVAPNWPEEYGGPGWDPMRRFIFHDECARAGAPLIATLGLQLCGPVIMRYGTEAQKILYLPKILSGEHYWCQGYSESEAGSDLAALRTRADRDGDDYVINGSKLWTTHAHIANWIFMLVRTSQSAKPQAGISFLLVPMDTRGVTLKPILSMSGEHELNAVFFDNVRVPIANRVGEENQGWTIAKYLLEFERGAGANSSKIERVVGVARSIAAQDDWSLQRRIAEIEVELVSMQFEERQVAAKLTAGLEIGPASSIVKLRASTLMQRATEVCMDALGPYAAPDQRASLGWRTENEPIGGALFATPTAMYLNARAATIYGGTAEIQRNILARMLGL